MRRAAAAGAVGALLLASCSSATDCPPPFTPAPEIRQQDPASPLDRYPPASAERVADVLATLDQPAYMLPVGGTVAAVRFADGTVAFASVGDDVAGDPLDPGDYFRTASITKTFTAALILSLVEDDLVDLDESVGHYLPDLEIDERITVAQLLQHTSGLENYPNSEVFHELSDPCPHSALQPEQIATSIDLRAPIFEPGTAWYYSNTGYVILGILVETVTGNDLAAELRSRVLEPAAIPTSFLAGYEPARAEPVIGYLPQGSDPDPTPFTGDYQTDSTRVAAAGALVSNAPDLLAFVDALFGYRIISASTLDTMLGQPEPPMYDPEGRSVGYSFGIHHPWDSEAWMHAGGLTGFTTAYVHDPASGITVVVLINCFRCITADGNELNQVTLATELFDRAVEQR